MKKKKKSELMKSTHKKKQQQQQQHIEQFCNRFDLEPSFVCAILQIT